MSAFCDVGVPWTRDRAGVLGAVRMCARLGYETVALNYTAADLAGKKGKKQEKGAKQKEVDIPTKDDMILTELTPEFCQDGPHVKQLTRFSVVLSDPAQTYKLQNSREIQSHDILSVQPVTEKCFLQACQTLDIDLISLNMTERLPFLVRLPQVKTAIERGVHFEICYCPMIRDAGARRNIISNARHLIRWCKGKNIVLSSCCQKPMELRGPYDLVNLGQLFGLTPAQAKDAITVNCRALLLHAHSRKTSNCVVSVTPISELRDKDRWKVVQDTAGGEGAGDRSSDGESEEEEEEEIEDQEPQREGSSDTDQPSPAKKQKTK